MIYLSSYNVNVTNDGAGFDVVTSVKTYSFFAPLQKEYEGKHTKYGSRKNYVEGCDQWVACLRSMPGLTDVITPTNMDDPSSPNLAGSGPSIFDTPLTMSPVTSRESLLSVPPISLDDVPASPSLATSGSSDVIKDGTSTGELPKMTSAPWSPILRKQGSRSSIGTASAPSSPALGRQRGSMSSIGAASAPSSPSLGQQRSTSSMGTASSPLLTARSSSASLAVSENNYSG